MRTEQEIKDKLDESRETFDELMQRSGPNPCLPDGSTDSAHVGAVSSRGFIDGLEFALGIDE